MIVRPERAGDVEAIRALTTAAFAGKPYASGEEAEIIDRLRGAGALSLSLVAVGIGEVIGHAAFSPVKIDGRDCGWFGLGPVAADPRHQRVGVGTALIRDGLARLAADGAAGCVLLGDPAYYRRFGFQADPLLHHSGAPAAYFQRLLFCDQRWTGAVTFHPAFG